MKIVHNFDYLSSLEAIALDLANEFDEYKFNER